MRNEGCIFLVFYRAVLGETVYLDSVTTVFFLIILTAVWACGKQHTKLLKNPMSWDALQITCSTCIIYSMWQGWWVLSTACVDPKLALVTVFQYIKLHFFKRRDYFPYCGMWVNEKYPINFTLQDVTCKLEPTLLVLSVMLSSSHASLLSRCECDRMCGSFLMEQGTDWDCFKQNHNLKKSENYVMQPSA